MGERSSDPWKAFPTVAGGCEARYNLGSLPLPLLFPYRAPTLNSDGDAADAVVRRCSQRMKGSNSVG